MNASGLLRRATALLLAAAAGGALAATSPLSDPFAGTAIDASRWSLNVQPTGPSVVEDGALTITVPASSHGATFGAGVASRCQLTGDFDIQADYALVDWPFASGVRLGLGVSDTLSQLYNPSFGMVERTSFGSGWDFPGWPREVYLSHFTDGVNGIVSTGDTAGTLRLVRMGTSITAFHAGPQGWVEIHTGPIGTTDLTVTLSAWSHDYAFTGQGVRAAFANFKVNAGLTACAGVLQVAVDVKPGSDRNPLNLGARGTLPVAIMGAAGFDVADVDLSTVAVAGAPIAVRGGKPLASFEDVDGDGIVDLVVHAEIRSLVVGADGVVVVTGSTKAGRAFAGSDRIAFVP